VEAYARMLNQLLEAKQREINIEDTRRMIERHYSNLSPPTNQINPSNQ